MFAIVCHALFAIRLPNFGESFGILRNFVATGDLTKMDTAGNEFSVCERVVGCREAVQVVRELDKIELGQA